MSVSESLILQSRSRVKRVTKHQGLNNRGAISFDQEMKLTQESISVGI
jgi:hypothetical protein